MTALLKKAFDMASSLPHSEQERLGARWIAEIKAEFFKPPHNLSGGLAENRQLLESINAVYDDETPDTEEQMLRCNMQRYHRRLLRENREW